MPEGKLVVGPRLAQTLTIRLEGGLGGLVATTLVNGIPQLGSSEPSPSKAMALLALPDDRRREHGIVLSRGFPMIFT